MRVAHVTPVFPPYRGGMGTVAYHQARALAAAGVEVTVFTPRSRPARQVPAGVSVIELPPWAKKGNAACLPQVLRHAAHYDLIHLHYPFFGTAELLAARRLAIGPPLVLQYQMDVIAVSLKARIFRWHRRWVLPQILRAADAVIVTSEDYAASSFLAPQLPALQPRLAVIPAGVDLDHLSPVGDTRDFQPPLDLPQGPTVFFLARLDRTHYFKGLYVLFEALRLLPDVHLLVGGDGEWRGEYEAQAAARLGRRVRFLGDIGDDMLPACYRAADVVAVPSTDRTEAFGLVLIEAMACGTPVVASRLPGVRTLVEEGRNGYLVEPGNPNDLADKIARCIREGKILGRNAQAFVAERYSWTTIAQQLLGLYEKLTSAKV